MLTALGRCVDSSTMAVHRFFFLQLFLQLSQAAKFTRKGWMISVTGMKSEWAVLLMMSKWTIYEQFSLLTSKWATRWVLSPNQLRLMIKINSFLVLRSFLGKNKYIYIYMIIYMVIPRCSINGISSPRLTIDFFLENNLWKITLGHKIQLGRMLVCHHLLTRKP